MANSRYRTIVICAFLIVGSPTYGHAAWYNFFSWFGAKEQLGREIPAGGVEKGYSDEDLGLAKPNQANSSKADLSKLKFDDPNLIAPQKKESVFQQVKNWLDAKIHPAQPATLPDNPFGPPAKDIAPSQGAAAIIAIDPSLAQKNSPQATNTSVTGLAPQPAPAYVPPKNQSSSIGQQAAPSKITQPAIDVTPHTPIVAGTTQAATMPTTVQTTAPRFVTTADAITAGINPNNLRQLTPYESIVAIGNGVDPKRVGNLRIIDNNAHIATSAVQSSTSAGIQIDRPYLGAGQQAIDSAFKSGASGNTSGGTDKSVPANTLSPNGSVAALPAVSNNGAGQTVYTFKQTAYGTVETFQNGQRIATTTPDYAAQRYGYNPAAPSKPSLSGFAVTKQDVNLATRTPATQPNAPSKTEYANAPGKPAGAIELKPPPPPVVQPRTYAAPAYRQSAPSGVNCAQLQMGFRQAVQNTGYSIDPNLYTYGNMLDRYCGGIR